MSNSMVAADEPYGASIDQPVDEEVEEIGVIATKALGSKEQAAKEMAYRRSIEQLKEEKRLRALISDYDFDDEL